MRRKGKDAQVTAEIPASQQPLPKHQLKNKKAGYLDIGLWCLEAGLVMEEGNWKERPEHSSFLSAVIGF